MCVAEVHIQGQSLPHDGIERLQKEISSLNISPLFVSIVYATGTINRVIDTVQLCEI